MDTSIIIALFRHDAHAEDHLRHAPGVLIPSIAVGELYYGAFKSTRVSENVRQVDEFVNRNINLACDEHTGRYYGALRSELRRMGRPIPENDIWIAALARQHDLVVASRDAHFQNIEGLLAEMW